MKSIFSYLLRYVLITVLSINFVFAEQNSLSIFDEGLAVHEKAGGHLIARHVGLTDAQLKLRLTNEPRLRVVSTFTDRAIAELAISKALGANKDIINRFMKSESKQIGIKYLFSYPIGTSMQRGGLTSRPVSRIILVLRKDPSMPNGYRIHTGYPTP